jgi:hypothetical protein
MNIISRDRPTLFNAPIDGGGSDIKKGALVASGITAEQDLGVLILSGADGANAFGVLNELHDFSEVGDSTPEAVANYVKGFTQPLMPGDLLEVSYDFTDTLVSTGGSTTAVTITSLEDNLDGGWLFCISGDAIGQLAYILAGDTSGVTTVLTTAPANGDTWIKLPPALKAQNLVKLTTDRTRIGTDAAAGSWKVFIRKHEYQVDGNHWIDLDPGLHSNLQLWKLNSSGVKVLKDGVRFRSILSPRVLAITDAT